MPKAVRVTLRATSEYHLCSTFHPYEEILRVIAYTHVPGLGPLPSKIYKLTMNRLVNSSSTIHLKLEPFTLRASRPVLTALWLLADQISFINVLAGISTTSMTATGLLSVRQCTSPQWIWWPVLDGLVARIVFDNREYRVIRRQGGKIAR